MLRRFTCLLILLSFLLLKGSALFVGDRFNLPLVATSNLDQNAEEIPDGKNPDGENKETKLMEFADDEYLHCSLIHLSPPAFSKRINPISFPDLVTIHLSLLNPPPDKGAACNANA